MTSHIKTLAERWNDLWSHIKPIGCSLHQERDMQKAFYAGVLCQLNINLEITEDGISEEESVAILEDVHVECNDFFRRMEG